MLSESVNQSSERETGSKDSLFHILQQPQLPSHLIDELRGTTAKGQLLWR